MKSFFHGLGMGQVRLEQVLLDKLQAQTCFLT